jgi:hypothetical protein
MVLPNHIETLDSLGHQDRMLRYNCTPIRRCRWSRLRYDYGRHIHYLSPISGNEKWEWEWNSSLESEWRLSEKTSPQA